MRPENRSCRRSNRPIRLGHISGGEMRSCCEDFPSTLEGDSWAFVFRGGPNGPSIVLRHGLGASLDVLQPSARANGDVAEGPATSEFAWVACWMPRPVECRRYSLAANSRSR